MKKQTTFIIALITSQFAFSQVGVNNTSPQATLDVTAKTTNGSKPEGFIAPRLTGDQIKSADTRYGTAQTGTLIYATAAVTTSSTKTANITAAGYYYFDGSIWQKVSGSSAAYTAGTGLTLTGTAFSANDASLTAKGIVQLSGDLAGTASSPTVSKIQGKSVSSTAPTNGQVLKYNTTNSSWEPSSDAGLTSEVDGVIGNEVTSATTNGGLTLSGSGTSASPYTLGLPTTGVTSGQIMKWDGSKWALASDTDTNTTYTASSGLTLTGTAFSANDASLTAKGIVQLSGDLAGTASSPTVSKIQGKSVSSTAPTNGQVLKYNTTNSSWEPSSDAGLTSEVDGVIGNEVTSATTNGGLTLSGSGTSASPYTLGLPTTGVTSGQIMKWDGTKWALSSDTDTNTTYTASSGLTLTGTAFSANDATTSAKGIVQLAGDLGGTSTAPTVRRIQNQSVSSTAPTNGQVLKYNTTNSSWEPAADAGLTSETDGVIGNEVKSATTNGGLTLSGSGTSASPYTLGLPTTGVTSGQIMKWDGTKWALGSDTDTNTTYTGSTSITLSGTSFERPALTGDVTAAANSNSTTVTKIQGTAVSSSAPTTAGESLVYNGTNWTPSSNTLTVSPEITTGTYTVKATDYFIRLNPTAAIVYINLPSTGIPVGKVIHIVNKGNKQANFLWDNVAPPGTLFYDEARPAVLGGGYSGTLIYLGGTGQGAWSFVVTY
ncbi:hypothetical protein [Flavobacterium sp. B17]|uniref:beta strand repeat-containing protein n=1 Tax=Flavobacterium sp. B17 TaxID=95618 RepID=UPI000348FC4A|nr:hypothetical protein [Flavobacterium sp. B17]